MPYKINNREFQSLLALYNVAKAEITRYRDREWANVRIFTASIVVVIGFIITNVDVVKKLVPLFDIVLILLAVGNIFYSTFTHKRLTINRNIVERLEYLLNFTNIKVGKGCLFPFNISEPCDDNFQKGWLRGFYSHLLPFFLADISLAVFGIWFIHNH